MRGSLKRGRCNADSGDQRRKSRDAEAGGAVDGLGLLDIETVLAGDKQFSRLGWFTRTHPIELPNGRIIVPLYSDGFSFGLMAISDDSGKTWHASEPIVGYGNIQPSVVRRKNGDLVAFMRDNRAATVKSIAKTTNYSEKIIDLSYDTEMQMISFDGAFSPKALDFLRNSFQELEILDRVPDVKEIYHPGFAPVSIK